MVSVQYNNSKAVLTSQLTELRAYCNEGRVRLTLLHNATELFAQTYVPDDTGMVGIYDAGGLIAAYLREIGESYANVLFRAEVVESGADDDVYVPVVLCDCIVAGVATDVFLQENFLTQAPVRIVDASYKTVLNYFAEEGEELRQSMYATFTTSDGTCETVELEAWTGNRPAGFTGVHDFIVDIPQCLRSIIGSYAGGDNGTKLNAVHVRIGTRTVSLYISPVDLPAKFSFRNVFGQWDAVCADAYSTEKQTAKRSVAVCDTAAQLYDVYTEQTFEVQVPALPLKQARALREMCLSRDVRLVIDSENWDIDKPILITEAETELTDRAAELYAVKFTYRFAENLPTMLASSGAGIFTEQFNSAFR